MEEGNDDDDESVEDTEGQTALQDTKMFFFLAQVILNVFIRYLELYFFLVVNNGGSKRGLGDTFGGVIFWHSILIL